MKKAFCTGTLAVSLLLGAARAADLFLNTDTATAFCFPAASGPGTG